MAEGDRSAAFIVKDTKIDKDSKNRSIKERTISENPAINESTALD